MQSGAVSWIAPLRDDNPEPIRVAPTNIEAEQALLGAIFRNPLAHGRVADFLEAEHFSNAAHQRIYAAISKLIDRGQIAKAVTIINAEDYGRRIHDLHLRRQLIGLGEDVVNDAFKQDLDDSALTQIERAEQKLYDLAESGMAEGGLRPFRAALTEAIEM